MLNLKYECASFKDSKLELIEVFWQFAVSVINLRFEFLNIWFVASGRPWKVSNYDYSLDSENYIGILLLIFYFFNKLIFFFICLNKIKI